MPEMTGIEFIKELLRIEKNPLIYIVTAEDDGVALAAAEKTIEQGGLPIKRYVSKPWPQSLFSVDLREDLRENEVKKEMLKSIDSFSDKQKVIQNELYSALQKLWEQEKRDAALGGAISVISSAKHELSNINTGISGNLELLDTFMNELTQQKIDPGLLERLIKIKTRLLMLSDRLVEYVDFIGILTQKVPDPFLEVSVSAILDSCLSSLSKEIEHKNIEVVKNYKKAADLPCYEKQLHLAFYHIIKNSIEAIDDGGTILLSLYEENSHCVIRFEDTGKGIAEDIIRKIFIPLFTQDKVYGGRGGSIVHKIITDFHKGSINIESYTKDMIDTGRFFDKAQGTIVTISLPSQT
jgi:signal transduction histidine kinase